MYKRGQFVGVFPRSLWTEYTVLFVIADGSCYSCHGQVGVGSNRTNKIST
jgi:hypothetical protein